LEDFFKINLFDDPPEDGSKKDSNEEDKLYHKKLASSKFKKKFNPSAGVEPEIKKKNGFSDFLSLPKFGSIEKNLGAAIPAVLSSMKTKAITLKNPNVSGNITDRRGNDTARLFGLNYNYPQDALTVSPN
jgi:hypothetical protein